MAEFILAHEPLLRLSCFVGVLLLMALLEARWPRRARAHGRWRRWPANLAIVAVNTLVLRLLFPAAAVGLALLAEERQWGLLQNLAVPGWAAVAAAMVLLDLAIYLQHVMFHAVPLLWRLHRMHHADLDFDVTTGARFHPLEIVLSMLIKLAVIAALGAPALAVLLFEVLLNASAMFNHSNLALPTSVDRSLRWLLVTPDMHRVHHSVEPRETNSNFGFNLPWWDRLFGTYRAQPAAGHADMVLGLRQFRDPSELRLHRLLLQPLRGGTPDYPLNRRGADPGPPTGDRNLPPAA